MKNNTGSQTIFITMIASFGIAFSATTSSSLATSAYPASIVTTIHKSWPQHLPLLPAEESSRQYSQRQDAIEDKVQKAIEQELETGIVHEFLQNSLKPLTTKKRAGKYQKLHAAMLSLEKWLGSYQKVQKSQNGYVAVFTNGSVPVTASFKTNKLIRSAKSVSDLFLGCPISKSLALRLVPSTIRSTFPKCPNLQS
jgi:hypothetical protein